MRILSWNICGGGTKRTERIVNIIHELNPDVCLLGEYHPRRSKELCDRLSLMGWTNFECAFSELSGAGLVIASKERFTAEERPREFEERFRLVHFPEINLRVAFCYAPVTSKDLGRFLDWVGDEVAPLSEAKALLVGDLNTCSYPQDSDPTARKLPHQRKLQAWIDSGWTDAYRKVRPEGTDRSCWTAAGVGFRIDHVFATHLTLPLIRDVRYLSSTPSGLVVVDEEGASKGWADRAASDHAAVWIEIS